MHLKAQTILTSISVSLMMPMPSNAADSLSTSLDLASTRASVPSKATGSISVGGQLDNKGVITGSSSLTISKGQLLTPAESVALSQALSGGQKVVLNASGAATSGTVWVSSASSLPLVTSIGASLSSLVVPHGVDLNAIGYISNNPFSVSGDAQILGSLHMLQTEAGLTSVLNFQNNLTIGPDAALSALLPDGQSILGLFPSQHLGLSVSGNFTNNGKITVPGNLNLIVGGILSNSSFITASPATILAQNINITSGSGIILNSGLISALDSISFRTSSAVTDLIVTNADGVFQAINQINVRDTFYTGNALNSLSGGNWFSRELNSHSGSGESRLSVEQISGDVNINAGVAQVLAHSPILNLGDCTIAGDPTYVNAGGDIRIVGTLTESANLAIIASGNITANNTAQIINHGNSTWLIAGANVNTVSGGCVGCGNSSSGLTLPPGSASQITSGFVQVSSTGASGGNIDLQSGNTISSGNTVIDTSSTTPGLAGGNVYLVALGDGSNATVGQVLLPTGFGIGSINASGNTTGANGNITIYAGKIGGQGISLGSITTIGGTGGGGNLSIATTQAKFSGGAGACSSCMSFDSSGTATGGITSTEFFGASAITVNGQVDASSTVDLSGAYTSVVGMNGRSISIAATGVSGSVYIGGDLNASSGDVLIAAATGITLGASVNSAGSLRIETQNGDVSQTGGSLVAAGFLSISTKTGNVEIVNNSSAKGSFAVGGGNISLAGVKAASINIGGVGVVNLIGNLDASGGGTNGSGGLISISGSVLNFVALNQTITSNGTGNGNGGTISFGAPVVSISGASPLALSANASGTGNGGFVWITIPEMVVGHSGGSMTVSATGGALNSASGNGGRITLNASKALTVDGSALNLIPLGDNGDGGAMEFIAGESGAPGTLTIAGGSLDCNGVGTGKGGTLEISVYSSSLLSISTLAVGDNSSGVAVPSHGFISANGGANGGPGGSIHIVNAAAGGIEINSFSMSANGDRGGLVMVDTFLGNVQLGLAKISTNAVKNSDGGVVRILGNEIIITGGNNIVVQSNAAGTGFGGSLQIETYSKTQGDITIANAPGAFKIEVNGGSVGTFIPNSGWGGGAGSLRAIASHSLAVDTSAINMRPLGSDGGGAGIWFSAGTAGNGSLNVVGPLAFDGVGDGRGWRVDITADSSAPLSINTLAGGTISTNTGPRGQSSGIINIQNTGSGGVVITSDAITTDTYTGLAGSVTITSKSNLELNVPYISASSQTDGFAGKIAIDSSSLALLPTQPLSLVANGNYIGGTITVAATASNQSLLIGNKPGSIFFAVTAAQSSNYGTVSLNAGKNIDIDGSSSLAPISAKYISLIAGGSIGVNEELFTEAKTVTASASGDILLNSLTSFSFNGRSSAGNVIVSAVGDITLQTVAAGPNSAGKSFNLSTAVDASGNGRIILDSDVYAQNIDIVSTSSGTGGGGIQGGGTLTAISVRLNDVGTSTAAEASNIGSNNQPVHTSSSAIVASSAGSIWLLNNGTTTVAASAGENVSVGNSGNISLQGVNFANGNFAVNVTNDPQGNGKIIIGGDVTANGILLQSSSFSKGVGGIQNGPGAGRLIAPSVSLIDTGKSLTTSAKDIGSSLSPIELQAGVIIAQTDGSIFLANDGTANLTANSKGNLVVSNFGSIDLSTSSAASGFAISTIPDSNGNGEISIGGNITANAINLNSTSSATGIGGVHNTGTGGALIAASVNISDNGTSTLLNSIGSSTSRIKTQSSSVSANSNGEIWISNTGSLSSLYSSSSKSFTLSNDHNINIGAGGLDSAGAVSLTSTANNGDINVNDGFVMSGGILSFSTNGKGFLTVGAGGSLNSKSDILISSAGVTLDGKASANGIIAIKPNLNSASIGINGGLGTYQVSGASLQNLATSTLEIGSTAGTGSIEFNSLGSTFVPQFDLVITGAHGASTTFQNKGTIDVGSHNLSINVGGEIATGTISGTSSLITLQGGSVNINDKIHLGNSSIANVLADGLTGKGSIQGAGIIVASTLNLSSKNDSIAGSPTTPLSLNVNVLAFDAVGRVNIKNEGILQVISSNGSSVNLHSDVAIEFLGNQTFVDSSSLTAPVITINSGVSVVGYKSLLVKSTQLNLLGTISGNPLIFASKGAGTIANSNPQVALDLRNLGNLTFFGDNLTILSAGSIVNTGPNLTIDLSGKDNGSTVIQSGSLNVIAGFNFTNGPILPVLPPSSGTFQLTTSNIAKNIDFSKVNIISSSSSTGGNVNAVATGTIKLASVNISASALNGVGGSLSVIGNGVTVGTINTSAFVSGSVTIQSGTPVVAGDPISIVDGSLSGGSFSHSFPGGNIKVSTIDTGNGSVALRTSDSGLITQQPGTTISTTGVLAIESGNKGFSLKTAAAYLELDTLPSSKTANVTVTSSVLTTLINSTVGGNLNLTGKGGLNIGAGQTVVGGNIVIDNKASELTLLDGMTLQAGKDISIKSSGGKIFAGVGTISANGMISMKTSGFVQISGTAIDSSSAINITGTTGVSIEKGATLSSQGNLTVSASDTNANLTINNDVFLSAGALQGTPPQNGVLVPTDIAAKGSVLLSAGSQIGLGNDNALTSNGGDIKITAFGKAGADVGIIGMGLSNQFISNGGNIIVLAKGKIYGNNGNFFHARAAGTNPSNAIGGGIELGSGLTSSSFLLRAFSLPKNTNPPAGALGLNVSYSENVGGVIRSNISGGGTVNLNWTSLNPSVLNLNGSSVSGGGGAQVFDAKGGGAQILFNNARYQTEAFKPISMLTQSDVYAPVSDDFAVSSKTVFETEIEVKRPSESFEILTQGKGDFSICPSLEVQSQPKRRVKAEIFATANTSFAHRNGCLYLRTGEMFVDAHQSTSVESGGAEVLLKRGALASIQCTNGCTYVRSCSDNGTVSVALEGEIIDLNSGEELLVADHKPDVSDVEPADRIGRRFTRMIKIGHNMHAGIRDFSILSLLLSNSCSVSRHIRSDKNLLERLVKTAATIDVVLKQRGAYKANR